MAGWRTGLARRALGVAAVVAVLGGAALTNAQTASGQAAEDYGIENGWFYTQARGQSAAGTGYAVIDTANIPFYTTHESLGGARGLGFPVSHRFTWDGAVVQAFQRGVLEWRPETGVTVSSVMNALSRAGFDEWLQTTYAVPPAGAPQQSLLAASGAIADAYRAIPNAQVVLGAPVALQDFGPVVTLRTEKGALQQWKVQTPFAPVGGVTIPNAGDVLGAAGVIPADASKAMQASYVYGWGGHYPHPPVAAPQPYAYAPYHPYWGPPAVNSQPYWYYPQGYHYGSYYPYGYGYPYGYAYAPHYPYTYPYYPYAPHAHQPHPGYGPYHGWSPYHGPGPGYGPAPGYGYGAPPAPGYGPGYGYGYGPPPGWGGPAPQHAVCLGDERMFFIPGRPGVNQVFTIEVTTARPQPWFELRGPGGPRYTGTRPGGRGIIYSWQAQIGSQGRYNFDFVVQTGTVCTANVVDIG